VIRTLARSMALASFARMFLSLFVSSADAGPDDKKKIKTKQTESKVFITEVNRFIS
jgi:hypothetical protein